MDATATTEAVTTQEIRVVDSEGHARILLTAKDGVPTIVLLGADGKATMTAQTDSEGRPSVTLTNPLATGPNAKLEIDDKGAHVKFDREGGASAYLFLNNQGGSGTVLIDQTGKRRVQATVDADGNASIDRLGDDGKPL